MKSKELNSGKGLSIAGIIISSLSMLFSIFALFIIGLFISYNMKVKDAVSDIDNNINDLYEYEEEYDNDITYYVGETFIFNDLEITIGNDYEFTVVNDLTSPLHNQTAVKIPVTIKNISIDANNLSDYYYKVIGTRKKEVVNLGVYFVDNAIDYAEMLNNGESYTKYIYFQYDGDGKYEIKFDNFNEEADVELNIVKY